MTNEIKATFDVTTLEGRMKILNAKNAGGASLKTCVDGTIIEAVGIAQYQQESDTYGDMKEETVTAIFTADGDVISAISKTVAEAATEIIDLVKEFNLDTFKVKVSKQKSSKGNEFFSLLLVG
ncbi:SSB [Bacillus phage B103]|uniref:Single-stranded DNA-binding protein n=1 Tax=Bacillus phage B103 TaxID=2994042 RepID=SSB_BPB03|nr:single strand DNA binding protein [Bacillus phage B103]Q37885.1 RecName: Full=Single-stranded DNA-binding protein; Short=SSB; AltName: Full=Gene product 5; Short=gp5; AltName: Full=Protein p5 [Bacillus phage B103]CAA67652.1 SSB [Bacillus phage B103]